ncbi:MAG TPA: ferritin family protein [Planctomycetes bacterium]|nr:ferritin family protein [Planctomycetota bacterium]
MEEFKGDEDILKFAIEREKQANRFYVALAKRVADDEMREVFEVLAGDEVEHKAKLELEVMKTGRVVVSQKDAKRFDPYPLGDTESMLHMDFKSALAIAIDKENGSFRLYADWFATARDEQQREILLSLAQEEAKHKARLEIEYEMLIKNQ